MKQIVDIFSKSPFGLLEEHMSKVSECIQLVKPISNAFINQSFDEVEKIKDIMMNCVPDLKVPFDVDVELVNNWGEVG